MVVFIFFFKQKTAYEMRISDWSSDVCSSDLPRARHRAQRIDRERAAPRPQLDIGDLRAPRALPQIGEREREQFAEHLADLGRGDEIAARADRTSVVSGKSGSVRVGPGGRRILKINKKK